MLRGCSKNLTWGSPESINMEDCHYNVWDSTRPETASGGSRGGAPARYAGPAAHIVTSTICIMLFMVPVVIYDGGNPRTVWY